MKQVLYIHIPFCPSGCKFCHFYLDSKQTTGYIKLLEKEFLLRFWDTKIPIDTIHIGGGTPNMLPLNELRKLFEFIHKRFFWYEELSIELHPSLLSFAQLDLLRSSWVTRISLWIQTFDPEILAHHTRVNLKYDTLWDHILYAKQIWFEKINFDLIYDLIWDSILNIKHNLSFIEKYKPTSVYYYRLRTFTEYLKKNYVKNERKTFLYYIFIRDFFLYKTQYTRLNNSVYYDTSQLCDKPAFLYDEYIYSHERNIIGLWVAATSDSWRNYTKNSISFDEYTQKIEKQQMPTTLNFLLWEESYRMGKFYLFFLQNSEFLLGKFTDMYWISDEFENKLTILMNLGFLIYKDSMIKLTEKWHFYLDDAFGDILFKDRENDLALLRKL